MTKILPALLALAMMTGAASAQQRTYYYASPSLAPLVGQFVKLIFKLG